MNAIIALSQNAVNTRKELNLIGANARGLKPPGRELLPLKRDMLWMLQPHEADIVMETVELLFAAELRYLDAQVMEQRATDTIDIAAARIDRGLAEGTCTALLYGSTKYALGAACKCAPIAAYAILSTCPELKLQGRLIAALAK